MNKKYTYGFYKEYLSDEIERLVLAGYGWEYPVYGLSRYEFGKNLHSDFVGIRNVFERTAGLFYRNNRLVACAIDENSAEGDCFFLFESKEYAQDEELLKMMLRHACTVMASVTEDRVTRFVNLRIPQWNKVLTDLAINNGFIKEGWSESQLILPFDGTRFDSSLPQGYTFADGTQVPAFFAANVHSFSFGYGMQKLPGGEAAFSQLRKAKHYNPKLDLYILDSDGKPVSMARIWYDESMPYCELEPLGVAWWERRKHLATAILHEAANRVMELYPDCGGMLGGDQPFYEKIGYVEKADTPIYKWEMTVYPSWEERSESRRYAEEASILRTN